MTATRCWNWTWREEILARFETLMGEKAVTE